MSARVQTSSRRRSAYRPRYHVDNISQILRRHAEYGRRGGRGRQVVVVVKSRAAHLAARTKSSTRRPCPSERAKCPERVRPSVATLDRSLYTANILFLCPYATAVLGRNSDSSCYDTPCAPPLLLLEHPPQAAIPITSRAPTVPILPPEHPSSL